MLFNISQCSKSDLVELIQAEGDLQQQLFRQARPSQAEIMG